MNSNWSYSPETLSAGQNWRFFVPCDLEIWRMTLKTIGHLFNATSSFLHHFVAIGELKLGLQSGNAQFGSKSTFFEPCNLEIWRMTLKNNRAPLQCYFKLCSSFRSHWWNETGITVRKSPFWVKIDDFFYPCDRAIFRMSLKSNRAPLLWYFKLCASFRSHWWIETGVTVQTRPIWVKFDNF